MKSRRFVIMGRILLAVGITLMVAGISMKLQPKVYKSAARVRASAPPKSPYAYDPYFILNEFEVIRSHAVLTYVIAALNLGEVWGKKYNRGQRVTDAEAEALIKHQLDLDHVSNTSFLQIGVYADDPNEAATLANAIARRYCDVRTVEFRRAAAENKHLGNSVESYGVVMMDSAVPRWRPVRPGYIAELMLIVGVGLTLAGGVARIIAHNYSRISSYFSEMYSDTP